MITNIPTASEFTIEDSFKITGALNIITPGALTAEPVAATPTFTWEDDSSEDEYHVVVLDSFGDLVWETTIPGESGRIPCRNRSPGLTLSRWQPVHRTAFSRRP